MENVATAVELALIAERYIVLQTSSYEVCFGRFKEMLSKTFGIEDVVEVDLEAEDYDFSSITRQMASENQLHSVVVWRNLEKLGRAVAKKNNILRVLDQLARHGTLRSREQLDEPLEFGEYTVRKPEKFMIVPIIENGASMPNINPHIKSRFWFSQLYLPQEKEPPFAETFSAEDLLQARMLLKQVFVKALITEYVCSLLVFTRLHRLCSLAPLTTRPSLEALDGIVDLAKALVVVKSQNKRKIERNPDKPECLYVIPEHVKIAYRKIGYWLVNWETNKTFLSGHNTAQKKTELSILTGDWYGSEWPYVKDYLHKHTSQQDVRSTTGFSNPIVEDVLSQVRPPL